MQKEIVDLEAVHDLAFLDRDFLRLRVFQLASGWLPALPNGTFTSPNLAASVLKRVSTFMVSSVQLKRLQISTTAVQTQFTTPAQFTAQTRFTKSAQFFAHS